MADELPNESPAIDSSTVQATQAAQQTAIQQQADAISSRYKDVNFYDPKNSGTLNQLNDELKPLGVSYAPKAINTKEDFDQLFADNRHITDKSGSWMRSYVELGDQIDNNQLNQDLNTKGLGKTLQEHDAVANCITGFVKSLGRGMMDFVSLEGHVLGADKLDEQDAATNAEAHKEVAAAGLTPENQQKALAEMNLRPGKTADQEVTPGAAVVGIGETAKSLGFSIENAIDDHIDRAFNTVVQSDGYWKDRRDHAALSIQNSDTYDTVYKSLGIDPTPAVKQQGSDMVNALTTFLTVAKPLGLTRYVDSMTPGPATSSLASLRATAATPELVNANRAVDNVLNLQTQHRFISELIKQPFATPGLFKDVDALSGLRDEIATQLDAATAARDEATAGLGNTVSKVSAGTTAPKFGEAFAGTKFESTANKLDDIIAGKAQLAPEDAASIQQLGQYGKIFKPGFSDFVNKAMASTGKYILPVASFGFGMATGGGPFSLHGWEKGILWAGGEMGLAKVAKAVLNGSDVTAIKGITGKLATLDASAAADATELTGLQSKAAQAGKSVEGITRPADASNVHDALLQDLAKKQADLETQLAGKAADDTAGIKAIKDQQNINGKQIELTRQALADSKLHEANDAAQAAVAEKQASITQAQVKRASLQSSLVEAQNSAGAKQANAFQKGMSWIGKTGDKAQVKAWKLSQPLFALPGFNRSLAAGAIGGVGLMAINRLDEHPDYSSPDAFLAGALGGMLGTIALTRTSLDSRATFYGGKILKFGDGGATLNKADSPLPKKPTPPTTPDKPVVVGGKVGVATEVPLKPGTTYWDKNGKLTMSVKSADQVVGTPTKDELYAAHPDLQQLEGAKRLMTDGTSVATGERVQIARVDDHGVFKAANPSLQVYIDTETKHTFLTPEPIAEPAEWQHLGTVRDVKAAGGAGQRLNQVQAGPAPTPKLHRLDNEDLLSRGYTQAKSDGPPNTAYRPGPTEPPKMNEDKLQKRVQDHGLDITELTSDQQAILGKEAKEWTLQELKTAVQSVTKPIDEPGMEGLRQSEKGDVLGWMFKHPNTEISSANIPIVDEHGIPTDPTHGLVKGAGGKPVIVYGFSPAQRAQMDLLSKQNKLVNVKTPSKQK